MIWELDDGQTVHGLTGGVTWGTEGPVLIMVHGAGMDATVWHLQTRYLGHRGVRALAIDLPGHGRTAGDPLSTIDDMADWLARAITALPDVDRPVTIAGHSMGTFIALSLAARHPELVDGIVLIATAEAMGVHPGLLDGAAHDLPVAAAMMADWGHGEAGHVGANPNPGMWMSGGARALVERSRPGSLLADFEACRTFAGAPALAAAVNCPVTLVLGAEDKMTPARSGLALAQAFPEGTAKVVNLPRVGHMLTTEAAADVRRLLLEATVRRQTENR